MVHRISILVREVAYNVSKPAHNSGKLWKCCEEETEEGQRQIVKREAVLHRVDGEGDFESVVKLECEG